MSADPNKKSARTFQCRDVLWGAFEQMANDLECSVDYLINEAMKQYARQRSQDNRSSYVAPGREPSQPAPQGAAVAASTRTPAVALQPAQPGGRLPPPARPPSGTQSRAQLPPPPPARSPIIAAPSPSRSTLPPGSRSAPPPLPRGPALAPSPGTNGFAETQAATLTLVYQGQRHTINKDRFVIGRGKQSSDLTLKDPNVSRQHAMVEFQNGVYFMVDLGSTNGVEFNGQRLARKQIAEGDVFRICDHSLSFTYR